jgi:hypothetical protein
MHNLGAAPLEGRDEVFRSAITGDRDAKTLQLVGTEPRLGGVSCGVDNGVSA